MGKENNAQETAEQMGKELEALSERVSEAINYLHEYKTSGLKANANDMMVLYNILNEYEKKISGFFFNTSDKSGTNNLAQYADLMARKQDAIDNKREIAKVIAGAMKEDVFPANKYKAKLNELLSEKERSNPEASALLKALSGYNSAMDMDSPLTMANAKQNLIKACIEYVKHPGSNTNALNTVYDIAACMGRQNMLAFNNLTDAQLSSLAVRKNIGYISRTTGNPKPFGLTRTIPADDAPESLVKLVEAINNQEHVMSPDEKAAACDNYLYDLYGNSRFGTFTDKDREQADKELGANASDAERQRKLGEICAKRMPWSSIKLDDSISSKEKFAHRQVVMRQWFPDDTKLLFGATIEKNKARSFYSVLTDGTYNGFFRSFNNSPEYTALLKALYVYTKTPEYDVVKDAENFEAVKKACVAYLDHYEQKEEKHKTQFANMRRDKVTELLEALGGKSKEADLTAKINKGIKMNVTELKKPVDKPINQSYANKQISDKQKEIQAKDKGISK